MKRTQITNNRLNGRWKITKGQKMADYASKVIGSWIFIGFQTVFITIWVGFNVYGFIKNWDPYPFILLNLSLSVLSAYAAPIILMSQNRGAERDRVRATNDLATDRKALREIQKIQKMLNRLERKFDKIN
ncbi:MAG: DUF1003 domain-containing protein [Patescibacteria group bacterium]|nr:DUF1003 domain-containing protein [Patescibacteria group bacterium]